MSRTLTGLGVSPGIAIGEPVVQETRPISTLRVTLAEDQVEAEVRRFASAVTSTVDTIWENRERARTQMGDEYAGIFEAHQLIATDPSFVDPVKAIIRKERVNAEWAIDQVVGELVARFEALPHAHLADRKLDVLDVARQILNTLHGLDLGKLDHLERPAILVADDLPPSKAVQLPMDRILGFALETGGPTAHTTIIARSFGIPVIVGARGLCEAARKTRQVAIDAFEGKIVLDPEPAVVAEYTTRKSEYEEQRAQLMAMRAMPSVTKDGREIVILANIDLPNEVELARQWNAQGIGLYRSEFLYMKMSPNLPSVKDHQAAYREIVDGMAPLPVTIRTFDLGGKKLAREVIGSPEANPVLGLRGIRLCFSQTDFFETQLRALVLLAGEYEPGRVQIMFPLISGIEEFRIARLLVRRITREAHAQGHRVHDEIPLGAMVEVPSSAVMATELAREADFLSIGTNDLIQYSLAVDRSNELVASLYRPTSPAILRLISKVVEAGREAGTPVSMCGEMASDPLMAPVLIGIGLTRFSMNPQSAPVVRALVRELSYRDSVHLAKRACAMVTARDVEEFLLERLAISLAKIKIRV